MVAAPPAEPRSRQSLLSLQVIRFLAAAMVLVHHVGYDADALATRTGRPLLALDSLFDWTFGVHLFFVLSGFIMVYAERDFGRPGAGLRFMLRRVIRVVPLYWLLTTALLAGAILAPGLLNAPVEGWSNVLGSYLFLPVMRASGDSHPVLGQGWTLEYEMVFYAIFALAMALPRRLGLAAVGLVLAGLTGLGMWLTPQSAALRVWTDPLLLEFLFGAAIALLRDAGRRFGHGSSLLLSGAGLAIALAASPTIGALSGPAWAVEGGAAALILAGFALGPPWPASRPVLAAGLLGDASYSLYLAHPFVIRPLRDAWLEIVPHWPVASYAVVAGLAAILGSLMLYSLVERPMTRRLRHWSHAGAANRDMSAGPGAVAASAAERFASSDLA